MTTFRHVFALAPDCHAAPGYLNLLWRRHFYEGLQAEVDRLVIPEELDFRWARQGHNVDPTPFAAEKTRTSERLWARIRAAYQEHGLDAVISYCFAFDVSLEVVRDTVQMGVPWINFFCDSTHMFEKVEPLARVVSLNWFPESSATRLYQALGVPHFRAPYAYTPRWLPDLTNRSLERTAVFIGFPSADRITRLGWLRVFGCPVEVRGQGWVGEGQDPFYSPVSARRRLLKALTQPALGEKLLRRLFWPLVRRQVQGSLEDAEFGEYVRRSLVILGLNQGKDSRNRLTSYLKFRDMEFPGYGCCYLTQDNEDIRSVFEVGKEVLTFRSAGEASAQIRRLRRTPELAREIGRAGRRRVLQEHHWGVRLRQLKERL